MMELEQTPVDVTEMKQLHEFHSALPEHTERVETHTSGPVIVSDGFCLYYGPKAGVKDITMDIYPRAVTAIIGPSGCGKTTLLRLIAGLETADRGDIFFAGRDTSGIPVHERGFGLMFQEHALFPHQNVAQNIAFGLKMKKASKER